MNNRLMFFSVEFVLPTVRDYHLFFEEVCRIYITGEILPVTFNRFVYLYKPHRNSNGSKPECLHRQIIYEKNLCFLRLE